MRTSRTSMARARKPWQSLAARVLDGAVSGWFADHRSGVYTVALTASPPTERGAQ